MNIQLINPLEDSKWDQLAKQHPRYTIFHSSLWAGVLFKTYGHKLLYALFTEGAEVQAMIPVVEVKSFLTGKRGVCLPFSDFCEPLLFHDGVGDAIKPLLWQLTAERHWRYFEIRGAHPFTSVEEPSRSFYGHWLDLSVGEEKLLAGLKGPVRSSLRKAEKSGVSIEVEQSREAVLGFYQLHALTRKKHGLPPQPISFFLHIYEEIIARGHGSVVLAKYEGRLVAASVFFYEGSQSVYKFGASDERFQHLRANNLLFWEAARFLAARGVSILHFGRTDQHHDGLRRFKLGWGCEEEVIHYYRFASHSAQAVKKTIGGSGLHTSVFGRLPVAVNRIAGSLIYPHLD